MYKARKDIYEMNNAKGTRTIDDGVIVDLEIGSGQATCRRSHEDGVIKVFLLKAARVCFVTVVVSSQTFPVSLFPILGSGRGDIKFRCNFPIIYCIL